MMKIFNLKAILALCITVLAFTSCEKKPEPIKEPVDKPVVDKPVVEPTVEDVTKFIVGTTIEKTKLLLTVDDIEKGSISVQGNGIQAINPDLYSFKNEKGFVFEYRKGNPAAMQSLILGEKGLTINTEVELPGRKEFISVFGDKLIVTTGFEKDGKRFQLFYLIDPQTGGIGEIISLEVKDVAEKGEYANFAGLVPLDNNRFIMAIEPFRLGEGKNKKGETIQNATIPSNFKDRVWVAIFKFDGKKTISIEKVIKDDRMSFAVGRRQSGRLNCIGEAADGNIYVFSPSAMISAKEGNFSSKPASVLKFDKKTLEFDKNYYFDIEALSGGLKMQQADALTGDYFLLNMYNEVGKAWNKQQANKLALFNVKTGSFKWIEGFPDAANIPSYTVKPFIDGDQVFIPLTGEGKSFIYKIDLENAKANKGLEILDLGNGAVNSIMKIKQTK